VNRPRGAEGAVAGGKRLARTRRRRSVVATPARTTTAVRFRLHSIVEGDGRLRTIIVEVEDARVAAGEVPRRAG
jgi:hypothetical protein